MDTRSHIAATSDIIKALLVFSTTFYVISAISRNFYCYSMYRTLSLPAPRRLCFCRFLFVCLSVCHKDNSKSYGRIYLKFWGYVGHGINYQWLNFGGDPTGILDSGSLWNFRYHCVKRGIREPLAKLRWWCHLANSFALAQVPAGYDCFLVFFLLFTRQNGIFNMIDHIWQVTLRDSTTGFP